jgi:hypothetical protein
MSRTVIFDVLAWVGAALLLYSQWNLYWLFAIVAIWIGERIFLFRRRCIEEGIWRDTWMEQVGQQRLGDKQDGTRSDCSGRGDAASHFRQSSEERNAANGGDDFWTVPRAISALVVVAYMIFAYAVGGGEAAMRLLIFSVLPLMCIWFPEFMGHDYRGIGVTWPVKVTSPSPPIAVSVLGWMVLALPIVVALLRYICR